MVMTNRAATEQCVAAGGGGGGRRWGGRDAGFPCGLCCRRHPVSGPRTRTECAAPSTKQTRSLAETLGESNWLSSRKGRKLLLRPQEKKKRGVRGVA